MAISFEDFKKVNLRIGKIIEAEKVESSERLLKLRVSFGELGERQIIAGLAKCYPPENLVGIEGVFVINLEPRTLMGLESQGMLLAASDGEVPIILNPQKEVPPGTEIR